MRSEACLRGHVGGEAGFNLWAGGHSFRSNGIITTLEGIAFAGGLVQQLFRHRYDRKA